MKRAAFWVGVFIAGGVVALVSGGTLGLVWTSLGWRKPVADSLLSIGVPSTVVAYWGLIWINLPDWTTAVLLGAVIGQFARSGKSLRYALVAGGGFIAYSLVYTVPYCITLADHDLALAMGTFWRLMACNVASMLLLLLAAWLFRRTGGKPVPIANTPAIAGS